VTVNRALVETVTRVAPLGVRFRDAATGLIVSDGLRVRERHHGVDAVPNRSGVWVAAGLSGLRSQEQGTGDDDFWASVLRRRYEFEVEDLLGRFAGFRFEAELPHRGVFVLDCDGPASPPESPPGMTGPGDALPLYSAATRIAPAGMAIVRADLWDEDADAPAAHAVLEAGPAGMPPALGLADDQGRVAVVLPYPEPPGSGGSPPGTPSLSLQTWPIELGVRYEPRPQSPPPGPPPPYARVPELPDLCAALGQGRGVLLEGLSPRTPLTGATLEYGRELVLRTAGLPTLVVSPAT
jgi:hypothetical protein